MKDMFSKTELEILPLGFQHFKNPKKMPFFLGNKHKFTPIAIYQTSSYETHSYYKPISKIFRKKYEAK